MTDLLFFESEKIHSIELWQNISDSMERDEISELFLHRYPLSYIYV